MKAVRLLLSATFLVVVSQLSVLHADVRTEEKSHIKLEGMMGRMMGMFGGKGARDGVVSTISVRGDRKSSFDSETGRIIDLAEERVYSLDMKKKNYEVLTFAEMRKRIEDARKQAEESMKDMPKQEAPVDPGSKQIEIDFTARESGQKKTINGFDCREVLAIITLREKGKTLEQSGGTVMTVNLWLTPTVKSLAEITDFEIRFARKLFGSESFGAADAQQMAMIATMYPGMKEMMGKLEAESKKLDGTSIMTIMTMEFVKSPEAMAEEQKAKKESEPSDVTSVRGIGGLIGRRIGSKKAEEPAAAQNRVKVFTSTSEYLKVSSTVSDAELAIPAGFKEKK